MPTTSRTRSRRPKPRAHAADTAGIHELDDVDELDAGAAPATAKRTVLGAIRDLPNFLRLLYGLMTDPRVAPVDKMLVGGAIVYVIMPMDLVPDFIPIIGEVDDVFVLVLALRRLMRNAGRTVLLDHWMGDPADLRDLNLQKILAAAAFFLPRRIRRRLRTIGRV